MNSNKIINLPNPQRDNEPVTKQYGDRTYLTDSGFVMNNIGMNNHMVTGLGTPTNNNDAATRKSTWTIKGVRLRTEQLASRWLTLQIRDYVER